MGIAKSKPICFFLLADGWEDTAEGNNTLENGKTKCPLRCGKGMGGVVLNLNHNGYKKEQQSHIDRR